MGRPFLTARWQEIALITYAVPRGLLEDRLPKGLEIDERNGQVFASLVAFTFHDCRVMGIRWPGLVDFPEVNLRYYVREKTTGRRGVVFIREFVRSRVIASVARWVYNEPYDAIPMNSRVTRANGRVCVEHDLRPAGAKAARIAVEADNESFTPADSTIDHFLKEHSWGFGTRRGRTLVYEVRHPVWQACRNARAELNLDFAAVYGEEWGILNGSAPHHVMLAVGSEVEVWRHRPLAH